VSVTFARSKLQLTYPRYKLAEKLSERLDDMGKDLTSMVEEINASSSALKNSKTDDPVSYTCCGLDQF
jgi:hypothetical protein